MQKALSKIKNLQLTAKLIFYILFVIVLPFTLLYLLALRSLSNTSSTVETKSLEQTTALVSQQLINNVKATGQIYDLTFKRQAIDAQTIQDGVSAGNFSMNLLSDFSHKHQFISDAFFIDPSGRLYTFPSLAGAATKVDLSQAAGFNFTNPVSYAGRWVGPYNDFKSADKTNTISYVAPVWKGSQYLGAVGLDIAISKFFSIAPLDPAQSSYVFVVRKDGSIISSSDQIYKDFGANTQQSNDTLTLSKIPDKKLAGRLAVDSAGSVGTFRFQSTGDEKLVAFAPITAFEAKIFVASPYKAIIALQQEKAVQLQKAVRKVGTSGLVYLVILGALVVGFAFWLLRAGIITPIAGLRRGIEQLERSNFEARVPVTSTDEIGQLASSFNKMAAGLAASNKQIHAEQAKLRASIESLSVGFMLVDNNQRIMIRNLALNKILNLDPSASLALEDLEANLRGSHPDIIAQFQKAYDSQRVFEMKNVPYGSKILRIFLAPVFVKELGATSKLGSVILLEDVTEERVLERSKDEFFSIASHELRTPLTAIKGNAQMIIDYYAPELKDEDLKNMIGDIHDSAIRLIEIVNDFLDVSRLEQGKTVFKPESFSIEAIIENVVYEMKRVLAEKHLYLNFDKMLLDALPKVWADKNRTKQIVYNLVGNAAKFTESGGITIGASNAGGLVKVSVSDTGRGIPLEAQKLLFHKFQQAGGSLLTRDGTKGTGLGLYISKMLVEKMGGQITLEASEPGQGTTFSFTLPIVTDELRSQVNNDQKSGIDVASGLSQQIKVN